MMTMRQAIWQFTIYIYMKFKHFFETYFNLIRPTADEAQKIGKKILHHNVKKLRGQMVNSGTCVESFLHFDSIDVAQANKIYENFFSQEIKIHKNQTSLKFPRVLHIDYFTLLK